jgi:hypothetical protein
MIESLVAINIISEGNIINKNGTPLLFYWDGEQDIYDALKSGSDFIDYLMHTVINKDKYASAYFSFFKYYLDENKEEHYQEDKINVQDFLKFKDLSSEQSLFYKEYLLNHFLYLYKSAYHEEYKEDISIMGIDDAVLDIYDKIQEKYPKRVIKSTVINYIRSELQKTDNISIENSDWVVYQLENLLNERE